jgi:hypothetical protein
VEIIEDKINKIFITWKNLEMLLKSSDEHVE